MPVAIVSDVRSAGERKPPRPFLNSPKACGRAAQLHFDNEAAAYITGSLSYIYDNGVEWPVGDGDAAENYTVANAIARGLKDKKGALVDEADFAGLRTKISLEPTNAGVASPNDPDDIGRW